MRGFIPTGPATSDHGLVLYPFKIVVYRTLILIMIFSLWYLHREVVVVFSPTNVCRVDARIRRRKHAGRIRLGDQVLTENYGPVEG